MSAYDPAEITQFWRSAGPERWFRKDPAFDAEIRARFEPAHMAAARRELDGWAATAEGALALLLLLDQFPRNLYRGTAHQFATDPLARAVATAALAAGRDRAVEANLRQFFVLPFEHSERLDDQNRAVALAQGDAELTKWAVIHRDIIARFGRFPHRNAALGRETTPEEAAFLAEGGFGG
jgi:uncharacterized protein (DUF924 family)